ncbi:hypothetical protein [Kineococcus indalonis]|uniref:hypothetical protein n=1 Tax=Kineococcus indalonis TaxID=2696566 RepID=UPI003899362F
MQLIWRKRRWRCREQRCPTGVWSEEHPALPARAKLTARAVEWSVQTLRWDDSTVCALARQLGVDWHTLMDAIRTRAHQDLNDEPARAARLAGVDTLGVDEHIWKPSARHRDRAVTSIVDLTRDQDGRIHARLLDVTSAAPGRFTPIGSEPRPATSSTASPTPHSTRSAATPTPSAPSCPTTP